MPLISSGIILLISLYKVLFILVKEGPFIPLLAEFDLIIFVALIEIGSDEFLISVCIFYGFLHELL